MKKKYKVYNVIILDESGSMQAIKKFTIIGFNEILETIQQAENDHPEQEHFVTYLSFNSNGIKTHLFNEPAKKLKPLNEQNFQPGACTPLFDAMGSGLTRQRDAIAGEKNTEVLVSILTDGMENASVEYNHTAIKNLVDELKKLGWTITYMGANHDVESFSISIGIDHHTQYMATEEDMNRNFNQEKASRMTFYNKVGMFDKGAYFEEDTEKEEENKDKE